MFVPSHLVANVTTVWFLIAVHLHVTDKMLHHLGDLIDNFIGIKCFLHLVTCAWLPFHTVHILTALTIGQSSGQT